MTINIFTLVLANFFKNLSPKQGKHKIKKWKPHQTRFSIAKESINTIKNLPVEREIIFATVPFDGGWIYPKCTMNLVLKNVYITLKRYFLHCDIFYIGNQLKMQIKST